MQALATTLRTLQLVAHNGHNQVTGPSFFSDHEFLGELYAAYEGEYDSVVERCIGEGEKIDLLTVQLDAATASKPSASDPKKIFAKLLALEKGLCKEIAGEIKGASEGTQNLLQGICDEAEVRQYQLGQRLK